MQYTRPVNPAAVNSRYG